MPNQKIKTGIIEKAKQSKNLNEFELLGLEFSEAKFAPIDFSQACGFCEYDEDNYFIYIAEKHNEKEVVFVEKGIGQYKEGKIKRKQALCSGNNSENLALTNRLYNFTTNEGEFLVVFSSVPENYAEALMTPHSVISSNEQTIQITQLPPNSILGRKDNSVEALVSSELTDIITESLSQADVLAKQFTCAPLPTRPQNPNPGTIIFNEETGDFEGFNGSFWRSLN